MPASVRSYGQTLKTLDLERYVAMYQRKPSSRKLPLLPDPLAGMIVVIDGLITNATAPDGGDDRSNPQRVWAFTVDDGSGGVRIVASKGQVMPMLRCMEASTPAYIVARLRFAHEVGSAEMLTSMLGWPRQPDDLVCEVLRAGASEGLDVRADETPEAQDEDREKRRRDDDEMGRVVWGSAGFPVEAPSAPAPAVGVAPGTNGPLTDMVKEASRGVEVDRRRAIAIARRCAKAQPESYYTEPFMPHEWVIAAILEAENAVRVKAAAKALATGEVDGEADAEAAQALLQTSHARAMERIEREYDELFKAIVGEWGETSGFEIQRHAGRVAFVKSIRARYDALNAPPLLGGPSLSEVADSYAGMPYRAISECCRHAVNAILLDVRRLGLSAEISVEYDGMYSHPGSCATVRTIRIFGKAVDSGTLLVGDAQRWVGGFAAAQAASS